MRLLVVEGQVSVNKRNGQDINRILDFFQTSTKHKQRHPSSSFSSTPPALDCVAWDGMILGMGGIANPRLVLRATFRLSLPWLR